MKTTVFNFSELQWPAQLAKLHISKASKEILKRALRALSHGSNLTPVTKEEFETFIREVTFLWMEDRTRKRKGYIMERRKEYLCLKYEGPDEPVGREQPVPVTELQSFRERIGLPRKRELPPLLAALRGK